MNFTKILSSVTKGMTLGASVFMLSFFWSSALQAQGGGDCGSAQAIGVGSHFFDDIPANGNNVTGGFGVSGALWFSYTATEGGTVTVSACDNGADPAIDTRLHLSRGTCGDFTDTNSDDDGCDGPTNPATFGDESIESITADAGETIFIEWDDRWMADGSTFTLAFEPFPDAPANDNCADATELVFGEAVAGEFNISSTDSEEDPEPDCASYSGGDSWFTVVMPDAGNIFIQTGYDPDGSTFDSGMAVYSGACGDLTEIACDDDANPFGDDVQSLASAVLIDGDEGAALIGQTLFVRVWEFGGDAPNEFTVTATFAECTVDCPDDIEVSAAAGTCEADVTIPVPTVSDACLTPVVLMSEGFDDCELPADWSVEFIEFGTPNPLAQTGVTPCGTPGLFSFDCTEQPPAGITAPPAGFDGCVATIDDNQAGTDFVGQGFIVSSVVDLSAAVNPVLTFDFQHIPFFVTAGGGVFSVEGFDGSDWVELFSTKSD